jgi:SET family sugar efflux transporter-like MFS transporter
VTGRLGAAGRVTLGGAGLFALGSAMITSSVSLFLAEEVRVGALMIGAFFAVRALSGFSVDVLVGVLSDRLRDRRRLIALCTASSTAGSVGYACLHNYWALLACGAVFLGFGGAAASQFFAFAREFADTRGVNPAVFTGRARALISLAWVAGPPAGLLYLQKAGFPALYAGVALIFGATAVLSFRLPAVRPAARRTSAVTGLRRRAVPLLAAMILLFAVNQAYQINIAIFVTRDAGLSPAFAGVLLGATAALEVPLMLVVGAWGRHAGKDRLLVAAALTAVVFFGLLPMARSPVALILLQAPNALWNSLALSIPLVMLQDLMPDAQGAAASLFSSALRLGGFTGGATVGLAAGLLGSANVFLVCAMLAAVAALVLLWGRISPAQTSPAQTSAAQTSAAQTSAAQTSAAQISPAT